MCSVSQDLMSSPHALRCAAFSFQIVELPTEDALRIKDACVQTVVVVRRAAVLRLGYRQASLTKVLGP